MEPVPAMTQAAPAAPLRRTLAAFTRRAAIWALADVGIAALLALTQMHHFTSALWYSECIGMSCVLLIDGGRLIGARVRRALGGPVFNDPDWPGWQVMAACVVVGIPCGCLLGATLGDLATGGHIASPVSGDWRGASATLLIALLCASAGTLVGFGRSRLVIARSEIEVARRVATESELRLLQAQLEPHMLFNTLANLRALIAIDPSRAQQMLDRLNAFLRAVLGAGRAPLHPLAAEFRCLDDYLALMAIRMGPRLTYAVTLPPALAAFEVPPLLLQPLVENAIRHGIEPEVGGGRIDVGAERCADRVVLTVQDNGAGLAAPAPASVGGGVGLRLVRERLAARYGAAATFTLAAAAGSPGGTVARIDLPLEGTR
jgi:hypothetical protein